MFLPRHPRGAGGNAWLSVLRPGAGTGALLGPLVGPLVGPLPAIGIGTGLSFGITDGQAMSVVDPALAGMAAGFVNTVRGAAEALMIAVFSAGRLRLLSLLRSRLDSAELAGRVASGGLNGGQRALLADAFTDAWRMMRWAAAGICAVAAVAVPTLLAPLGGGATKRNGTATVRSRSPRVREERPGRDEPTGVTEVTTRSRERSAHTTRRSAS